MIGDDIDFDCRLKTLNPAQYYRKSISSLMPVAFKPSMNFQEKRLIPPKITGVSLRSGARRFIKLSALLSLTTTAANSSCSSLV
ncbi:hypothetical protein O9929_00165 [Vibrio lentus]|nr:hypothetical protein [Vibrio lentus]